MEIWLGQMSVFGLPATRNERESTMRFITRNRVVLAALAIALVLGSGWLLAGGTAPLPAAQTSESSETPLPDFQPTEKLPADSAVAFPTDI